MLPGLGPPGSRWEGGCLGQRAGHALDGPLQDAVEGVLQDRAERGHWDLARTSGDRWPTLPTSGHLGRGVAGGVDFLSKVDEAPKSHIFFPANLAVHLWAERPGLKARVRDPQRTELLGTHPTQGKVMASKSGFDGPVAGALKPSAPHVQSPGPWSQIEGGAAWGPLVHLCTRV